LKAAANGAFREKRLFLQRIPLVTHPRDGQSRAHRRPCMLAIHHEHFLPTTIGDIS
jgi:hypothetical protein